MFPTFDNSKNFTFCGTHRLTWCSFYLLIIIIIIIFPSSTPNTQTHRTQELLISYLFIFFLQPPIPTTTTSVLSLKHEPRKFISILDRPIFDLKQIQFGAHFRQLLFFPLMRQRLCAWEWLKPMIETNTKNNFGCGVWGLGEFNGRWCFN